MTASSDLQVGDVVQVGRACLGNPPRAVACCVERYQLDDRPGFTLLFQNGESDGFSPFDLAMFQVVFLRHDALLAGYRFVGILALERDVHKGRFAHIFAQDPAGPDLFAWVGEDELGGGRVGLKQARVPAGTIALVAVDGEKITRADVVAQLQRQADAYGKTIRLVRYVAVETVLTLDPRPQG